MIFRLLPKEQKQELRREYLARVATVSLALFSVIILLGIILLIPSHILSSFKYQAVTERFKQISKSLPTDSKPTEIDLTRIKALLSIDNQFNDRKASTEIVNILIKQRGTRVKLHSLNVSYDAKKQLGTVVISGVAANREGLLSFVRSLEREGIFEPFSVPISNFAKSANIDFSISTAVRNDQ